jgi:hypothetical protein
MLLAAGANDPMVTLADMKGLHPEPMLLEGAGHNPHVEQPKVSGISSAERLHDARLVLPDAFIVSAGTHRTLSQKLNSSPIVKSSLRLKVEGLLGVSLRSRRIPPPVPDPGNGRHELVK